MKIRHLSERELATILAALREFQIIKRGDQPDDEHIERIATGGWAFPALAGAGIDLLCAKISRVAEKAKKKRTKEEAR